MSIEYSSNIIEKPAHLNIEFLQNALENARLIEYPNIEKIHLTLASNPGDNYCSEIYRAKIIYSYQKGKETDGKCSTTLKNEQEIISFIIKCVHNTSSTEFLKELRVFHKEKIFYKFVLPRLEMLLLQHRERIKFAPSMYLEERKPSPTLVFEDLGALKFQMASREKGLDLDHAKLVLERLGQMHAASMILFEKMPELKVCFESGMLANVGLSKKDDALMSIIRTNLEVLLETMEKWPGFEDLSVKIRKYTDNLMENLLNSGKLSQTKWKVLNHGDLWVNNFLFLYDNQQKTSTTTTTTTNVCDIRFVDFQLSYWNSPGIDLNYFFHTSLEFPVFQKKRDYLLSVYHNSLCNTLQQIDNYAKFKIPTLEEIHKEFNDYLMYGFYATYTILPVISMDKSISGDNSLENFTDTTFVKNKMRQNFTFPGLQEKIKYHLREFDRAGIFD